MALIGLASLTVPLHIEYPLFEQGLDHLFHEEGCALGALDNLTLKWTHILGVAEHHRERLFGTLATKGASLSCV